MELKITMSNFSENLIEAVRKNDCLYSLKSHNYRRVDFKESISKEIAVKLGVDGI